jgi:hypothetical protein
MGSPTYHDDEVVSNLAVRMRRDKRWNDSSHGVGSVKGSSPG